MFAYFFEYIWKNWLIMAFFAPFFMALVNILDIHFVRNVYRDARDGVFISGIFQLIPWILVPLGLISFHLPDPMVFVLALMAGGFLSLAGYFYFRTIFLNDMVLVQTGANTSVLVVPFLAWLFTGEKLALVHYLGIALAFLGITILTFSKQKHPGRLRMFFLPLFCMVSLLSFSMVLQGQVYRMMDGDFWTGFLLFILGGTLVAFGFFLRDSLGFRERLGHIFVLSRENLSVFILAESLGVLGIFVSQRAIDLSPSVSFVMVIESLLPIFVLFLSGILVIFFWFLGKKEALSIYVDQFTSVWFKLMAILIIVTGVYLIT